MSYHVAILDNNDVYQNLYTSTDGSLTLEFYNARVDENFSTGHSLVPNTNTLNLVCFELQYDDMTEEQKTNINANISTDVKSFAMIVSP
jgi:hypothetical protein